MSNNVWNDGKVYEGQKSLRIRLACGTTLNPVDITGALATKIYYKANALAVAELVTTFGGAVVVESSTPNGIIYFDFVATGITPAGQWEVWNEIQFADGRQAPGDSLFFTVYAKPS